MAFFLSSSKVDDDDTEILSEINIIPLVDVMLVLLIIFMVAAPLSLSGIDVRLPKVSKGAANQLTGEDKKLVISVNKQGEIFHEKTPLSLTELSSFLEKRWQQEASSAGIRLIIQADKEVIYSRVVDVMNVGKSVGFQRIGLVAQTPVK